MAHTNQTLYFTFKRCEMVLSWLEKIDQHDVGSPKKESSNYG